MTGLWSGKTMAPLVKASTAVVMATVVAGCGVTRYTHVIPVMPDNRPSAAYSYVVRSGGPLMVEVHNAPASADEAAIAAAMPSPPGFAPVTFASGDLPATARPELADYRYVLVFGAPETFDGDDACALRDGQVPTPTPTPAPVMGDAQDGRMVAAFCYRADALRQVRVSGPEVLLPDGAASSSGQSMLWLVSAYLVPPPEQNRCGMRQSC